MGTPELIIKIPIFSCILIMTSKGLNIYIKIFQKGDD